MIYKVLYQDTVDEVPARERTKALYIEADSIREVRKKLSDRQLNIEYVQELDEAHLEFEKQSEDFELEKI